MAYFHSVSKKGQSFKMGKNGRNVANMDMILAFLAKPLHKHGTTLVHITYQILTLLTIIYRYFSLQFTPISTCDHPLSTGIILKIFLSVMVYLYLYHLFTKLLHFFGLYLPAL